MWVLSKHLEQPPEPSSLVLAASAGSEGSGWRPVLSQIAPLLGELL